MTILVRARRLAALPLFLLLVSLPAARAVEEERDITPPPFDPKTARTKDMGVGIISPYDKFIALQQELKGKKIAWAQLFTRTAAEIPPAVADREVILPLLLGVRISDGVMAIQARDVERLNKCAGEIERAARALGAGDSSLARARDVRAAANAGEWLKVFADLGFLQQDIMRAVDAEDKSAKGRLVIIGGWLQGVRYVTSIVRENWSPETSNFLREPLLVKALGRMLDELPERERSHPVVQRMQAALRELQAIVDIPLDGQVPLERVNRANALASEVIADAQARARAR